MNDNKKVITYCPNFYKIINFKPINEDNISLKIIDMYKSYIFNVDITNEDNINEIKYLDEAISKYIDDYNFRKELKKGLLELKVKSDCTDILKYIIDYIISLFNRYKASNTRIIYISRWI